MKILILKDKQKTEIPLSDSEHKMLSVMFSLPKKEWPDKVKVGNNWYDKFTIGDLREFEENFGEGTNELIKEYYDKRRQFLKLSLEEKVEKLKSFFYCIMYYLVGKKINIDNEYSEYATEWLSQHPTRSTLSVKDILKKFGHLVKPETGNDAYKDFNIRLRKQMFNYMIFAENKDVEAEANDIEYYKNKQNQYEEIYSK